MATSSIKIYRTHITPARNALVDDIEAYLASLTPTYSNLQFQYLKLGLNLDVIVPEEQSSISKHDLGNYCRIVEDNKIWYYFIMNTEWVSSNAVKLKLSIDSINTFRNDLTWDKKTTIARQHMPRLGDYNGGLCVRLIDHQPENINAFKKRQSDTIIRQTNMDYDWYLLYTTSEELSPDNLNNPVNCYCLASESLLVKREGGVGSVTWTAADLTADRYYDINITDNPDWAITLTTTDNRVINLTYNGTTKYVINNNRRWGQPNFLIPTTISVVPRALQFYKDGSHIRVYADASSDLYYNGQAAEATFEEVNIASITFTKCNIARITTDATIRPINSASQVEGIVTIGAGPVLSYYTMPYNQLDKTDSKIVKIIKLPYCPVNVVYNNGVWTFPNEWIYADGKMKLNDLSLSTEFENQFYSLTPTNPLNCTIPSVFRSTTALRNILFESKLYNSDFYTYKYVYDSFSNEIRWELFDPMGWAIAGRPAINFTFKPTNTINSKFDIYADYLDHYDSTQDYEGHLLINRNNEETIFSNDFINYIRTGYNYDKKAKEQSTTMSYLGAGISLVGSIAAFAASTVTGGLSVAAGVALAASAITGFASAASTQVSNERALESKLAGLKAQSTGVAGADDVDLMSYYSDNRMHIIIYDTETVQRQAIWNLFFYCGYAHNANEVPNLTSRYWFNYIMCKPVFKEEGITPYNEYIDDIKARYAVGVTVYHQHNMTWDWDQQYENWENYIAETFSARLDVNWITDVGMDDEDGMTGRYSGFSTITLDGTNLYIEWEWYLNNQLAESGNSRGQTITPGSSFACGPDGQYQYQSYVKYRIYSATSAYTTTPWKTVQL